jgi:enoyl-CoA hydratase/3-hydroxyacyl-CoA dehydrogenase
MSWNRFGRAIDKVGVIGSGQIGPDIALYLTKVLAPQGVQVVVNDISQDALDSGSAKLRKKVDKGVSTGAFKAEQAQAMVDNVLFTADKGALKGAGLIIEAATEDLGIKRRIFADLEELCGPDAIMASNSSHLEPEAIFAEARHPGRTLVHHFFFPAERNPVVEVVRGSQTAPEVTDFCMRFYEAIGKVPVEVGSRYGYAVDPIFEGLFLAALLIADEGIATHKQVDVVAQKVLGLGVGPFTAMNLTGGTPITRVGLEHYHDKIMPWFHVPDSLKDREEAWPAPRRGEDVEIDDATFQKVAALLKGAYFGLVAEVLDSGITNVDDLEMAVELALVMKAPFKMMNAEGVDKARELVEAYAARTTGFKVAQCLTRSEPWKIRHILRRDHDGVAVLTVRRPRTLNALNRAIFKDLAGLFGELKADDSVRAVVITGFGVKAFVSGADIGMLAKVSSEAEGQEISWESNEALLAVQSLGKPVVCALNGLALGGGSELAMACTTRIARKGLKVCFGQPEPKLGIIPGAGATQRLPRIVGMGAAWEILRTGRQVSGSQAFEMGYLAEEVEGDLVDRAMSLARELADGTAKAPAFESGPIAIPGDLPEVDLGPGSRKVDEILCKAIREGCTRSLEEGLRFESECFGQVCGTKDKAIGIENFFTTQLKEPAPFVHA